VTIEAFGSATTGAIVRGAGADRGVAQPSQPDGSEARPRSGADGAAAGMVVVPMSEMVVRALVFCGRVQRDCRELESNKRQ
jgi:hypothetical protein